MSNINKLITDFNYLEYDHGMISEALKSDHGTFTIKGVLQRANAKNQNGRIYPREILEREAVKYSKEFVQQRRALGELDHPESTVVNLKNVSHNIVEMHWEGDDLCGTIEILSTPAGNIVKELMRNKIRLGVSSRGVGSVVQMSENTVAVDEDFNLICFDIVSNPSTQGAFLAEGHNHFIQTRKERVNGLIVDFFGELGA